MEIKTCEERILWELELAENEIAHQEKVIRDLNQKLGELSESYHELKEVIYSLAKLYIFDDKVSSISFDSVYENFDGDKFNKLQKLLPLIKVVDYSCTNK